MVGEVVPAASSPPPGTLCRPSFSLDTLGPSVQHVGFWGEAVGAELRDPHSPASPEQAPFPTGQKVQGPL